MNQKNLVVYEAFVDDLIIKDSTCCGVITKNNQHIYAKKIILTTGTYMKSIVMRGKDLKDEGPDGQKTIKNIIWSS